MIILFDLHVTQSYSTTRFHGGGKYGQNLLFTYLSSHPSKRGIEVFVTKKQNVDFEENIALFLKNYNVRIFEIKTDFDVLDILKNENITAFYSILPEKYQKISKDFPSGLSYLATLHDLRDLEIQYDRFFVLYQKKRMSRIRQRLRHVFKTTYDKILKKQYEDVFSVFRGGIFTVSKHSAYALKLNFPHFFHEKIQVFYPIHIPSEDRDLSTTVLSEFGLMEKEYFLMINCNRPGKNALRVLSAMNKYPVHGAEGKKFACIGFTDYHKDLIRKRYPRVYKSLVFIPYVEDAKLEALYKNAFSLIFPSVSEGFGYPPLEAMRFGLPVIASSVTAIPEVCSNAAVYFNPYDEAEIANRIMQICNDSYLYETLKVKGLERYQWYCEEMKRQKQDLIDYLDIKTGISK